MRSRRAFAVAALLLCALPCAKTASAHRLDEYLQATILAIDKDHLQASMRLIPGIAVSSAVIAAIDSDGDGVFSVQEQRAYAQRVLADLSLTLDGIPLQPRIVAADFPAAARMNEGLGEIRIEFTATLPRGGPHRTILLENHHRPSDSVYLVNSLVPTDRDLQIVAQQRNERQSLYQVDYVQSGVPASPGTLRSWRGAGQALNASGFPSLFRLGMRHIAEGTDHLLFLLVLLLPAPLLVSDARWSGCAGPRQSILRILKIVTAFTLGHSITLALAAWGLVSVPSRPVEVLIAVSILVSAIHALRPLFPGREAALAAFFGLVHGLAFAATLTHLGLGRWERVFGILAFNLGIETMQLVVVAATMPSLVLMSRTRAYALLRVGGALVASLAALGWIDERLFGRPHAVDAFAGALAHHAGWLALALFAVSLGCVLLGRASGAPNAPGSQTA